MACELILVPARLGCTSSCSLRLARDLARNAGSQKGKAGKDWKQLVWVRLVESPLTSGVSRGRQRRMFGGTLHGREGPLALSAVGGPSQLFPLP